MAPKTRISRLLGYGEVSVIAKKLNLSLGATSAAIRRGNPGHPAVKEALRLAQENGALATAQLLANLPIDK
jgi:hypothetical protein